MKKSILLIGIVLLTLLMAVALFAAPASNGPTGILNVPTAEVVTPGSFELQVAYDRYKIGGVRIEVAPIATLGYGFQNGEIGVSYFNIRGYTAVKSANAKYIILQGGETSPSIAAGVIYLNGDVAETDAYLVASGSPSPGGEVRGTIGLLYQKPNSGSMDDHFTGMIGLEFRPLAKTSVGFDYIFKDIAAGNTGGATIRHAITPDLTLQFGVGNNARWMAGMTMKFGGK